MSGVCKDAYQIQTQNPLTGVRLFVYQVCLCCQYEMKRPFILNTAITFGDKNNLIQKIQLTFYEKYFT